MNICKKYLLLMLFASLFINCAYQSPINQPVQKNNLTSGMVKKEIIKGQTTQAEVLSLFGAPNLVTMNSDDLEVWNYNKMAYTTQVQSEGASIAFWGGSRALRSSTTQSFDLILLFNESDIVQDYSVISATY